MPPIGSRARTTVPLPAGLSTSNVPRFSVDVYQNAYLPEGGREGNAIVTVGAVVSGSGWSSPSTRK